MAGPSWHSLGPRGVQEGTDEAVLPSSGKAHHRARGAICAGSVPLPELSLLVGVEGEEEGVNTDFWRH